MATDPGHASGNQVYVIHPRCLCADAWAVHERDEKTGQRKACSNSACGCRVYRPDVAEEAVDA